jgi:putative acetyltransferase
MTGIDVKFEPPDQAEVIALISELDAFQDTLYPPESRHSLDLSSVKGADLIFAVARDKSGRAIGCGAVVLSARYGEIKRMYVQPRCRGQGVARRILEDLESAARLQGRTELVLETGPYQPEALAFYESRGYRRRGPFGGYVDDPLSVFMQKSLAVRAHRDHGG